MRNAAPVVPSENPRPVVIRREPALEASQFRLESLIRTEPRSLVKGRSLTLSVSMLVHAVLIFAVIIVPILLDNFLPAPGEAVRAFFVSPPNVAPPPPPPPPPAPAGARALPRPPAEPRHTEPAAFTAPVEVPSEIKPEEGIELGVQGGVPGGVEGGVAGGVVGGIIGGLPAEPPPPRVVRIGGQLVAPKLVHTVKPEYPPLAASARAQGLVILEALVDVHGYVKTVKVLRGGPLFDDAAVAAVKQWRYKPLLLNGTPTAFILTVTVMFNLTNPGEAK